ncbi:hypothetical protein [Paractinoplanes durhamensis]|uniref:hypothetical protein n=1 Tax=Paractinoplanes durhamensis TaxID=113563 RepID=UPI0036365FC7
MPAAADGCARFTAESQADLVKITALDARNPEIPPLLDVRLASARGTVDSSAETRKTVATGRYADAKLAGLQLPGLPSARTTAERVAPGEAAGDTTVGLAELEAGGLATVSLGKAVADARWTDAYSCTEAGPLTRAGTMLTGVALLGGGRRTALLRLGPSGSTRSATDLVRLPGGRRGVAASAGIALTDLTLFGGTPQEISVKVLTQPTLTVIADGGRPRIDYRPATLAVTAGGKSMATLSNDNNSVGLSVLERVSERDQLSLLGVRLSIGEPREEVSERGGRAEVAALRLEVTLGRVHVLDVALGYLSASASLGPAVLAPAALAPPRSAPLGSAPPAPVWLSRDEVPVSGWGAPVAQDRPEEAGVLAVTGANVAAIGTGGGALLFLGVITLVLVRRRLDR